MRDANTGTDRIDLWAHILNETPPRIVAEIGVWKGEFAAALLGRVASIQQYVMIDPWAQLPDWNKPFNLSTKQFDDVYDEAMRRVAFASSKLRVLRGRTRDKAHEIKDESLDFVYIDGDHTLRGIAIDLIKIYPKVRPGGLIGGDDFSASPWQHSSKYEPTLVCPFAVYFAEAMDVPIKALPFGQFLIEKSATGFRFEDTTGNYKNLGLNKLMSPSGRLLSDLKGVIKTLLGRR